jgi:type II secretory pathway component PulF
MTDISTSSETIAPFILAVPAVNSGSESPGNGTGPLPTKQPRVKVSQRDLAAATSQLSILMRSGMDLTTALESLARQTRKPAAKKMLSDIHQRVLSGLQFSEALSIYENTFGASYVASVRAGEASGKLTDVLIQLAQLRRQQMRMASALRAMMAYPIILTCVSSTVIMALLVFVLPRFGDIFADFESGLPWITKVLLAVSTILRGHLLLLIGVGIAAIVGLVTFLRSRPGQALADRLLLNGPILSYVSQPLLIGRACRLLGMMIENGVPVLEAIQLTRSSMKNRLYIQLFGDLENEVVNGRGLGNVLLNSKFVPAAAAEMLVMAEQSGSLELVTQVIGDHYEEEGESRLRELVNYAEPVLTVSLGLIIAVVILAVMLPMFDLATAATG